MDTSSKVMHTIELSDSDSGIHQHVSPLRRPRLTADPEDEENQDPEDEVKISPKNNREARPRPRLVVPTVKTSGSTINFALSADVIKQIPPYQRKLDVVKRKSAPYKRLHISDTRVRDEEALLQTIEYLTDGTLPIINDMDTAQTLRTLHALIPLYELSVSLEIPEVEHAIADLIQSCEGIGVEDYVEFAGECYAVVKNDPRIWLGSKLGQVIRMMLVKHLPSLTLGERINEITGNGDLLFKQLLEVLAEKYQASTDLEAVNNPRSLQEGALADHNGSLGEVE